MTGRPYSIVILGGGTSGQAVAQGLGRLVDPTIQVTLVDPRDHQIDRPSLVRCLRNDHSLPDCWRLSEMTAASPVRYLQDSVEGLALQHREVHLESQQSLPYDHLVLALGTELIALRSDDLRHYLYTPTNLGELHLIRSRIQDLVDELADEPGRRARIVIVGAGPLGVEVAAECALLRRQFAKTARLPLDSIQLELLERDQTILPGFLPRTRHYAQTWLEDHGVKIVLSQNYTEAELAEMMMQSLTLVIVTAGHRPPPLVQTLPLAKDRAGFLLVDDRGRAAGTKRVWVAGDLASHPHRGHAEHATTSGEMVAQHLAASLGRQSIGSRSPDPALHARIITLGSRDGILERGRTVVTGPLVALAKHWQRSRQLGKQRRTKASGPCQDCRASRFRFHSV